jgi:hypothetical protein
LIPLTFISSSWLQKKGLKNGIVLGMFLVLGGSFIRLFGLENIWFIILG